MLREAAISGMDDALLARWPIAIVRLLVAWLIFGVLAPGDWSAMAHQWWNIDTYNHILLVPAILAWLVWLRREELAKMAPSGSLLGLVWISVAFGVWLIGRTLEANLLAQAGLIGACQGAVIAVLGLRASLVLAFPLAYTAFLVPFGDELIPVLQALTAQMAIGLTHLSGVPAVIDGLFIDTPAGRFVVAEECSGVKFLIAMISLSVLVGWTGFRTWKPRIVLVASAALISIIANGVRAWGTIFAAQYIGIERAGGFDHVVYGWVFFAVIITLVIGAAWHHFDRLPEEAGLTARDLDSLNIGWTERYTASPNTVLAGVLSIALAFAALASLV